MRRLVFSYDIFLSYVPDKWTPEKTQHFWMTYELNYLNWNDLNALKVAAFGKRWCDVTVLAFLPVFQRTQCFFGCLCAELSELK